MTPSGLSGPWFKVCLRMAQTEAQESLPHLRACHAPQMGGDGMWKNYILRQLPLAPPSIETSQLRCQVRLEQTDKICRKGRQPWQWN